MPDYPYERDIEEQSDRFDAAEAAMLAVVLDVANGVLSPSEGERALGRIADDLTVDSAEWSDRVTTEVYLDAVEDAERHLGAPRTAGAGELSVEHRALLSLQTEATFDDLAAASRNMARDGRGAIREIAARKLQDAMFRGPRAAAVDVAEDMERRGVRFVDDLGRRWGSGNYARMVMRTKTIETRNRAHLSRSAELGSPGVLVTDGRGGDTDQPCMDANGEYWSNAYAAAHLLEHPNCTRTFTPLPRDWEGTLDRE
jgi:hypothetical protein